MNKKNYYPNHAYAESNNQNEIFPELNVKTWTEFTDVPNFAINQFTEDNPDTVINLDNDYGYWEYCEKFKIDFADNIIPDAFIMEDYKISDLRLNASLSGYFAETEAENLSPKFTQAEINDVTGNGVIYGVPCTSNVVGLYYNREILDELGINVEELNNLGWDEFIEIALKIKDQYPEMYAFPLLSSLVQILVHSFGEESFEDYYDNYGEIYKRLNEDEAFQILELFQTLRDKDLIPQEFANDKDIVNAYIAENKSAFIIGPPWVYPIILKCATDYERGDVWGVTKIPTFSRQVCLGGTSWLVPITGNEEYAYKFLNATFGVSDDLAMVMGENNYIPAWRCEKLGELDYNSEVFENNVIDFLNSLLDEVGIFDYYNCCKNLSKYKLSTGYMFQKSCEDIIAGTLSYDDVKPKPLVLSHIEIETAPDKTEYYEYENFDKKGMTIRAFFTDGTSYVTSNFNYSPQTLKPDDNSVTVYLSDGDNKCFATQSLTVKSRNLISITAKPARKYYFYGDKLSYSDFYVTAIYDKGPDSSVSDFSFFPFELTYIGNTELTFSYKNFSCSLNIYAYPKLTKISIKSAPTKRLYYSNGRIDREGLVIEAEYSNGSKKTLQGGGLYLSPKMVRFESGTTNADIKVSYTERDITCSSSFTVYKKSGAELDDCDISQDMGASGKGFVNLSSGYVKYKFEDFVGSDGNMPINVSRVYKDGQWRLNVQQVVRGSGVFYKYTDKDGKVHDFVGGFSTENGRSAIRNEKLGLDLFADDETIRLVDRNNNALVFGKIGDEYKLSAMHQYPSTPENVIEVYSMQIDYDPDGKISKITAGKSIGEHRPTVNFKYGENSLLQSLEYEFGDKVTVVKYAYDDNNRLSSIEKLNGGVNKPYGAKTRFIQTDNGFEVIDLTSKNPDGEYKSLKYELDATEKVLRFSVGYGETDRDISQITYNKPTDITEEKVYNDVVASTVVESKNTVSVAAFNSYGIVSQYSYEKAEGTDGHKKSKKILSASSYGYDYKTIADTYSDTLDLYSSNFANTLDGWTGGIISDEYGIASGTSLTGITLKKSINCAEVQTLYLSLWVYSSVSFSVKVEISGKRQGEINRRFSGVADKWHYIVFPLGKIYSGENIAVTIDGSGRNLYVDGVHITKAPYEIPDEIPEDTLTDFGNAEKTYEYNPVDNKIACTHYRYDSANRLVDKRVTIDNEQHSSTSYAYNSDGLLTRVLRYGKIESGSLEERYDYSGYDLISHTDENGVETKALDGVEWTATETPGGEWSYIIETETKGDYYSPTLTSKYRYYGNSDFLKEVTSSDCANKITYNADGTIEKAVSGTEITYGYDSYGNVNTVKVGETALVTYSSDRKHLNGVTYADGSKISYGYDGNDRVTEIRENDENAVTITYSDDVKDAVTVTHANGLEYCNAKVNKGGVTGEYSVTFEGYDETLKVQSLAKNGAGNVTKEKTYFNNRSPFEEVQTTTDRDGLITELNRINGFSSTYEYDDKYRLSAKKSKSWGDELTVTYAYDKARVAGETFKVNSQQKDKYGYEYCSNGNLKRVYSNDALQVEYNYDANGRLKSEDNKLLRGKYEYTYDTNGNILSKKIGGTTYGYTYANEKWKDQLTSYNGKEITYDGLGNPVNYMGKTMQWVGRKLKNCDGMAMEYDYNGLRVKKGGRRYYWQCDRLKAERWEEDGKAQYIYYYYDESGISGINRNGTEYYYRKNVMGDIIAIYDRYGTLQCRYIYDAWGNHKVVDENGNEVICGIGVLNPIRYRGYYYDSELGLYYLQSRYYDPEVGRFISADDVSYLNPESIFGLNLYAYCGNNPVMNVDPSGEFLISTAVLIGAIIGGIVGAGIGFGVVAYQDYQDDGKIFNGSKNWYDYLGATILGGAIGAAVGAAIGYAVGYFAGGTYANGMVAKSINSGVRAFISQANKVNHVLGKSAHKLINYTTKSLAKLMKTTLAKGTIGAYKTVQSAFWAIMGSEVTFTVIDGVLKISDMWIR